MNRRRTAEHEAAHAVVASCLGVAVTSVTATATRGRTTIAGTPPAAVDAVICAAGDLWEREFSSLPYQDGSCSDLARLVRTVGAGGVWQARRDARRILAAHRAKVLRLAAQLERHGTLTGVGA